MRYYAESRLQDEGWQNVHAEFDTIGKAIDWAIREEPIHWGMLRIIDKHGGGVIAEFPAVSPKEKEKMRVSLPTDKVNYPKGDTKMARKEFVYSMLGSPILKLEIDDSQYEEIAARVKRVLDNYKKMGVPQEFLDCMEEEGLLAHVKYAVGRCRAKYEPVTDKIMDGKELVGEAFVHIQWWYAMLENGIVSK
jgi:hypothetical protein